MTGYHAPCLLVFIRFQHGMELKVHGQWKSPWNTGCSKPSPNDPVAGQKIGAASSSCKNTEKEKTTLLWIFIPTPGKTGTLTMCDPLPLVVRGQWFGPCCAVILIDIWYDVKKLRSGNAPALFPALNPTRAITRLGQPIAMGINLRSQSSVCRAPIAKLRSQSSDHKTLISKLRLQISDCKAPIAKLWSQSSDRKALIAKLRFCNL